MKQGISLRKEARATKLVAVVMRMFALIIKTMERLDKKCTMAYAVMSNV